MKISAVLVRIALLLVLVLIPAGVARAQTESIKGVLQSIKLEINADTGGTTVLLTIEQEDQTQQIYVSIETATTLGVLILDADGNPQINDAMVGQTLEIQAESILPDPAFQPHPVAEALSTFFSDIPGLSPQILTEIHDQGVGFGIIAQTLWITRKMEGDAEIFLLIIDSRNSKDFSAFLLEDGSSPKNWGQLKKAILQSKKEKPDVVVDPNLKPDKPQHPDKNKPDKEKDKNNNGQGNSNKP